MDVSPDGTTVTRAIASAGPGMELRLEARTFVLAAGAIENARILLASPGRHGGGIGNESDHVGRWFMDHVSVDCAVIEAGGEGLLAVAAFAERHDEARRKFQAMLWLGEERIRREELLNAAFWVCEADAA